MYIVESKLFTFPAANHGESIIHSTYVQMQRIDKRLIHWQYIVVVAFNIGET